MARGQAHYLLAEASWNKEFLMNSNCVEQVILPRRIVLQGALALGCGLLAPTMLTGCDSRQGATPASDAPGGSAGTQPVDPYAPAATKKATQVSVQYQQEPKGDQTCAGCQHFIPDSNSCMLVEGQINPDGWCILWVKQA